MDNSVRAHCDEALRQITVDICYSGRKLMVGDGGVRVERERC